MEFPIGTVQVPSSSHIFQGPISLGFSVQDLGFRVFFSTLMSPCIHGAKVKYDKIQGEDTEDYRSLVVQENSETENPESSSSSTDEFLCGVIIPQKWRKIMSCFLGVVGYKEILYLLRTQYRPQYTIVLIMGIPQNCTPNYGKP